MKLRFSSAAQRALATIASLVALSMVSSAVLAQPGQGRTWTSDPRADDRTYHFADTGEDLPYCVYASSKISADTPAPLIISLHGLGAPPQVMCNTTAVDLAEEGGYVLAAPMGYSVGGWYGAPVIRRSGGGNQPENLEELSEKDVMNVLAMIREEFNVDENRIYLTGHSMGGAGTLFLGSTHTDIWAAIAPVAPAAFALTENRSAILGRLHEAGIPVMIIHGDADEVVSVDLARTWAATMEEIGIAHEYVELPGVTHGPVITVSQEHVYRFFDRHSR
jgi:poly(3-hydroxybutyrate) depolymerase